MTVGHMAPFVGAFGAELYSSYMVYRKWEGPCRPWEVTLYTEWCLGGAFAHTMIAVLLLSSAVQPLSDTSWPRLRKYVFFGISCSISYFVPLQCLHLSPTSLYLPYAHFPLNVILLPHSCPVSRIVLTAPPFTPTPLLSSSSQSVSLYLPLS